MSACVYAMMGGVRRIVPPESRSAIHRMSSQDSVGARGHGSARTTTLRLARMVSALASYAAQMGVSPTVIRLAERILPQEHPYRERERIATLAARLARSPGAAPGWLATRAY